MARLSDEEIEERLAGLDGLGARRATRSASSFELDDFKGSVDFVNRLTPVAEEMNHHPDLDDLVEQGHGHDHAPTPRAG